METATAGSGIDTTDCYANILMRLAHEIQELAWLKHRDVKDILGYKPAPGEYKKLVGWIPEAYTRWAGIADPADFSPLADAMDPVFERMGISRKRDGVLHPAKPAIAKDLGSADDCFDSWHGDAKENFGNFSKGWDVALDNQANLALVLQDSMVGTANIYGTARGDIQEIARQTLTALQALGPCGGSSDAKVVFTIASALTGVASTMASGGTIIALAAISAGTGAVSNLVPDQKEVPLGASTAKGVIDNMSDAMRALSKWVDGQERIVVDALKKNLEIVTASQASYVAKSPKVLPDPPAKVTKPGWLEPT